MSHYSSTTDPTQPLRPRHRECSALRTGVDRRRRCIRVTERSTVDLNNYRRFPKLFTNHSGHPFGVRNPDRSLGRRRTTGSFRETGWVWVPLPLIRNEDLPYPCTSVESLGRSFDKRRHRKIHRHDYDETSLLPSDPKVLLVGQEFGDWHSRPPSKPECALQVGRTRILRLSDPGIVRPTILPEGSTTTEVNQRTSGLHLDILREVCGSPWTDKP